MPTTLSPGFCAVSLNGIPTTRDVVDLGRNGAQTPVDPTIDQPIPAGASRRSTIESSFSAASFPAKLYPGYLKSWMTEPVGWVVIGNDFLGPGADNLKGICGADVSGSNTRLVVWQSNAFARCPGT